MKVTLWMAVSLNGIIAGEDGNEDFLSHDNWIEFSRAANKVGCIIWGRKTYESVVTWDKSYLDDLSNVKKIIVSHDSTLKLKEGFTLANSPKEALEILSKSGFNEAILTGGSTNNSTFAKEGLINEIIVDVEPAILGKGIPLFKPKEFLLRLELVNSKKLPSGILQLHYKVIT